MERCKDCWHHRWVNVFSSAFVACGCIKSNAARVILSFRHHRAKASAKVSPSHNKTQPQRRKNTSSPTRSHPPPVAISSKTVSEGGTFSYFTLLHRASCGVRSDPVSLSHSSEDPSLASRVTASKTNTSYGEIPRNRRRSAGHRALRLHCVCLLRLACLLIAPVQTRRTGLPPRLVEDRVPLACVEFWRGELISFALRAVHRSPRPCTPLAANVFGRMLWPCYF